MNPRFKTACYSMSASVHRTGHTKGTRLLKWQLRYTAKAGN